MKLMKSLSVLALLVVFALACNFGKNNNNSDNNNNNSNNNNSNNSNNSNNANKTTKIPQLPVPSATPEPGATPMPTGGGSETITHGGAGIEFTIPAGWSGKASSDRYTVAAPDDNMEVYFYVPSDGDFDAALAKVRQELSKGLDNISITNPAKKVQLNGMQAEEEVGKATYQGRQAVWAIDAIHAPKNHLFVVTVTDANQFEQNKAGYQALLNSIKKSN